ncbi:MAG: hypothetical protein COS82_10885 [Zetaproteobacteria bacterium CG06_land_8_20_14_3_00_59_53]|nr:MAG: hypothetical protein AUK36_09235 [Zetaproteobacteria bacterium CG2_30_59_37]PIO90016.1 MAG: hypothetical protein COX56_04085 [Zetaproteobacteria bacterium CG23_combo_of_CG06-09_8_20_14_all_59_86]PIQ65013.1 MAG: hypothetical protein COV97_06390 [Zetaproteobacteria bacterium CG11_big_fil_rev_8_21_14_0_20_59_439]PIU69417.1 MAG: hypothetical protein COS82_10885 [Zetaproteobacteria bacterium CG06_land_8_20_14_3_00_59_53]PIU96831.1 MAG: hypothetical protein COS62_07515 [Zetaproteobacteria bac
MAAHGLLLAGILLLLPDGMRAVGPAVAGVEVELLPVGSSRKEIVQTSQEQSDVPEAAQAHLQSGPGTSSESPVVQRDEKQTNVEAVADAGASRKVETAGLTTPPTQVSQAPVVQGAPVQEHRDARPASAADIELEKARNVAVRQRLERFKHYPASARRRGIEGAVDVSFRLNAQGRAENMQLVSGSGYGILDDAALNTVRRAEPFPVTEGSYRFRLRFTRS